jgi:hypothetical protein
LRKAQRNALPKARAAARHDRNFIGQAHFMFPP